MSTSVSLASTWPIAAVSSSSNRGAVVDRHRRIVRAEMVTVSAPASQRVPSVASYVKTSVRPPAHGLDRAAVEGVHVAAVPVEESVP